MVTFNKWLSANWADLILGRRREEEEERAVGKMQAEKSVIWPILPRTQWFDKLGLEVGFNTRSRRFIRCSTLEDARKLVIWKTQPESQFDTRTFNKVIIWKLNRSDVILKRSWQFVRRCWSFEFRRRRKVGDLLLLLLLPWPDPLQPNSTCSTFDISEVFCTAQFQRNAVSENGCGWWNKWKWSNIHNNRPISSCKRTSVSTFTNTFN